MPSAAQKDSQANAAAQRAFDELVLARAGVKDRTNIEKHLAACESEPHAAHAQSWRRMAGHLATLTPLPPQTVGQPVLLYHVPDGKYRMQVFALEDRRDGLVLLYMPNVLPQAIREKILLKPTGAGGGETQLYRVGDAPDQMLEITAMDAANSPNPPPHVKHMIGWNRKAIMVTMRMIDESSAVAQIRAAEALATLAAKQWAKAIATDAKKAPAAAR